MYALRALLAKPLRLVLTIGGIGLCVILMLFLTSLYRGVADGTLAYLRASPAELWVLHKHTTNVLRSTSVLPLSVGQVVEDVPGVASADPVLFVLAGAQHGERTSSLYLAGYDVHAGTGKPPELLEGRQVAADDEIVVDRVFARKNGFRIGDELVVNGLKLRLVGLSTSTNLFVVQYGFTSIATAERLLGVPGVASCFQVRLDPGADPGQVAAAVRRALPVVNVYQRDTFLENNRAEMDSGFLPLLFVVAVIGAVVLTVILGLLLSVQVLEQRLDFAAMKALGAPRRFVPQVVLAQGVVLGAAGTAVAVLLFFPLVRLIEAVAPEVTVAVTASQIAFVALGVVATSVVASVVPVHRAGAIHPLEVLR